MLYECLVGSHNMLSTSVNCENQHPMGPVGYIYETKQSGTVALHRCRIGAGSDHFVSTDPGCEGQKFEQLLGYVLP
jgi:hypothetical protein